jgi:hypothetical protein
MSLRVGVFFFLFQISDIEKLASFSSKITKLVKYKLEKKISKKIPSFPFWVQNELVN